MIDEKPLLVQFEETIRRKIEESIYGGPLPKRRQTAIRVRGHSFETVELDDDGKVIEPVRCACGQSAAFHRSNCPLAYGAS